MKRIYCFVLLPVLSIVYSNAFAQSGVAINGTGAVPNSKAILDLDAAVGTKGLLAPRMTAAERGNVGSPSTGFTLGLGVAEKGMTIFNTTSNLYEYWDGSAWQEIPNVANSGNTLDGAYDEGGPGAGRIINATNGNVEIQGPGFLTVASNVGIGITNPDRRMKISGSGWTALEVENTDAQDAAIELTSQGVSNYLFTDETGFLGLESAAGEEISLRTDGANERMVVQSDGRVRINNLADPSSAVVLSNAAGVLGKRPLTGSTTDVLLGTGVFGSASAFEDDDWYQALSTNTPTGIGDWIYTNGHVGIGTGSGTNPSAPLHVVASGAGNPDANSILATNPTNSAGQDAIITARVAGASAGDPFFSLDISGEAGWSLGIDNSDDNRFKIAPSWSNLSASTAMTIQTDGNVGLGTTAPQHKLSVGTATSDGQPVTIRGYSNSPSSWKGGAAFGYTSASVIMGELSGVAQIGGHNGTLGAWADLAINSAGGNVGIGTTGPAQKLEVAGNVRITGLSAGNVQSNANGDLIVSNNLPSGDADYIWNQYGSAQGASSWVNGTARADGAMRAPLFSVADYNGSVPAGDGVFYRTGGQAELTFDDWFYMRDDGGTIRHQFNSDAGEILLGPNTGWSRYLRLGGNGNNTAEANIATTDGNLHLDSRSGSSIYLNYYNNTWVRHGNGSTGYQLTGNFEYFDDDSWIYNRYAPNDRVYFENRLAIKGTISIAGNPYSWADARCTGCGDAISGNPNLWLTAQDRVYITARNTDEAYEFGMETPGSGNYDKGVVPQFANYGRLGTPNRYWWTTYSGHFRYKHYWDDYEGFDTYDDIAELRAIEMDTVWDPILNHHVGKIRGETIPKFLTNYEDEEGAGEFIDVRRMDGFLLGASRQIDRETVERDERLAARTEVLARALGVDFTTVNDNKVKVKIQDRGSAESTSEKVDVRYSDEFVSSVSSVPHVSITPTAAHQSFYVSEKNKNGFSVLVNKGPEDRTFSFDWTATAESYVVTSVGEKVVSSTDDVFYRKPIVVTGKNHPINDHSKKLPPEEYERAQRNLEIQKAKAEEVSRITIQQMNDNAKVPEHSKVPETPSGNNVSADPSGRSTPAQKDSQIIKGDAVSPRKQ